MHGTAAALDVSEVCEEAARAIINQRCAASYLHDVRGTMQALFSALELLGRSAKASGGNPERVAKACELAKRAISSHERTTLEAFEALTLAGAPAAPVNLHHLVTDVVRFLRNEAAEKGLELQVGDAPEGITVFAERGRLHAVLVGLLLAAIDDIPRGGALHITLACRDGSAVLSLDTAAGFDSNVDGTCPMDGLRPGSPMVPNELTLLFTCKFLAAIGGRLDVRPPSATGSGALQMYIPLAAFENTTPAPAKAELAAYPC